MTGTWRYGDRAWMEHQLAQARKNLESCDAGEWPADIVPGVSSPGLTPVDPIERARLVTDIDRWVALIAKDDANRFLTGWITENINAEAYEPEGDDTRARGFAALCRIDAKEAGIPVSVLDAAARDMIGGGDDLVGLMANALKSTTDAEVQRLASKDDV